jgi:hypothetical protein
LYEFFSATASTASLSHIKTFSGGGKRALDALSGGGQKKEKQGFHIAIADCQEVIIECW